MKKEEKARPGSPSLRSVFPSSKSHGAPGPSDLGGSQGASSAAAPVPKQQQQHYLHGERAPGTPTGGSVKFGPLNAEKMGKEAGAAIANLMGNLPNIAKTFTKKKGHGSGTFHIEDEDLTPKVEKVGREPWRGSAASSVKSDEGAEDEKRDDVAMGVLSKWINIGRGWGPRLFILEGGVLSYYKLDGQDKASVRAEWMQRKHAKLIGEEILRLLRKEKDRSFVAEGGQLALGEIHLLVATLRESKSDDNKFYVYSGTKTLDLRAESSLDRATWMEMILAAKGRLNANMKQLDELEEAKAVAAAAVKDASIKLLTQKLEEAGVAQSLVTECEEIVRVEVIGNLQKVLTEEQRRRLQLQRRVQELETDKAQLETAVVAETHFMRAKTSKPSTELEARVEEEEDDEESLYGDEDEGSTGPSLLAPRHRDEDEGAEGGEDEFFETMSDFIDSGRWDNSLVISPSMDMEKVGFSYPHVKRREALPEPAEKEKVVGLWSIIKEFVGKDVSRVSLPVYFNEPISTLQKCCEDLEYSWLLDRAAVYGQQGNQVMRALHVAAFAVSGYASTNDRVQKPFNPLIAETFEADYPDKGFRFFAEKVQHNPNTMAVHCEGRGWRFWADNTMKIRFWGPSMQLDPLGVLSVEFEDGELYEWSKVTTGIYNIILGKLYIDHYGTMKISSNRGGLSVRIKFKERSMFDRNIHQVQGFLQNETGEKLATLVGKWSQYLQCMLGDPSEKAENEEQNTQLLWKANALSEHAQKYRFTPFIVTLNEITPEIDGFLPPTDSRLRPDQRMLEEGHYDAANEEKLRLEQRQRQARKDGEEGWKPRWFEPCGPNNTWTYKGGYWERRAAKDWNGIKDIFAKEPVPENGDP